MTDGGNTRLSGTAKSARLKSLFSSSSIWFSTRISLFSRHVRQSVEGVGPKVTRRRPHRKLLATIPPFNELNEIEAPAIAMAHASGNGECIVRSQRSFSAERCRIPRDARSKSEAKSIGGVRSALTPSAVPGWSTHPVA